MPGAIYGLVGCRCVDEQAEKIIKTRQRRTAAKPILIQANFDTNWREGRPWSIAIAARHIVSDMPRRRLCEPPGPRSEVTLGAKLQRYGVLVLELVNRRRLGSRGRQRRGTGEVLVEAEILHFGREGQVLDRRPARDHTHLVHVEVRVA